MSEQHTEGATARVALITNIMAPYRIPLLNQLAQSFKLTVLAETGTKWNRHWPVPSKAKDFKLAILTARGWKIPGREASISFRAARRLLGKLDEVEPDVILVGGYSSPGTLLGIAWASLRNVPSILWFGTTKWSVHYDGRVARAIKRHIVTQVDAYFTYSRAATDYLRSLGVPRKSIFTGINIGDIGAAELGSNSVDPNATSQLRFVYAGQMIRRKGIFEMLDAFECARLEGNWQLSIIGSGPLATEVAMRAKAQLGGHVELRGFMNQDMLYRVFSRSHVLVVPSLQETGAIVTSEGLAHGMYVIGSCFDGVAEDLLTRGLSGTTVDPSETGRFAEEIREAAQLVAARQVSRRVIRQHVAEFAGKNVAALRSAIKAAMVRG